MSRWHTVSAVDLDKAACAVYRANFPGVPVQCCRVEDAELPPADVILAGFPCQPHSFAGERKASADERDGGDAFLAAIERVRPRMFLGENVAGILSSEGGKYAARLLALAEAVNTPDAPQGVPVVTLAYRPEQDGKSGKVAVIGDRGAGVLLVFGASRGADAARFMAVRKRLRQIDGKRQTKAKQQAEPGDTPA